MWGNFFEKKFPHAPSKNFGHLGYLPASLLVHLIGVASANNVTQSEYPKRVRDVLSRSRGPHPNDCFAAAVSQVRMEPRFILKGLYYD